MIDPADDAALGAWFADLLAWDAGEQEPAAAPRTVAYGDGPEQVADLWLPEGVADPAVVVSIHGGYFMEPYRRDLHVPITRELVRRGFGVWNIEYRRTGSGGFAETTADVWAAVDALVPHLGNRRLAVFGHSAGGYLTEWLAPHPAVELVIPLAAATDLAGVVRAGWDGGAVSQWLGAGPDEDPELYAATSLVDRLPASATHVLIHGTADRVVGIEQSRAFADEVTAAGDPCTLLELADEGHYAFVDPREAAFRTVCAELERWRDG